MYELLGSLSVRIVFGRGIGNERLVIEALKTKTIFTLKC